MSWSQEFASHTFLICSGVVSDGYARFLFCSAPRRPMVLTKMYGSCGQHLRVSCAVLYEVGVWPKGFHGIASSYLNIYMKVFAENHLLIQVSRIAGRISRSFCRWNCHIFAGRISRSNLFQQVWNIITPVSTTIQPWHYRKVYSYIYSISWPIGLFIDCVVGENANVKQAKNWSKHYIWPRVSSY